MMSRLDLIASNSNNSIGQEKIHKKFTPYLFSNQLKDLGFVVVPFTNNQMVWSVQNFDKIYSGCNELLAKMNKKNGKNLVLWLDPEGIILDFHTDKSIKFQEVKKHITNAFTQMDIEGKEIAFKGDELCFRFNISFKMREN